MLSFSNLLKELKTKSGEYLIIFCVCLLISLQVYSLYEICNNTHKEYKKILYNTLLTKTTQLNTTISQSASYGVFAYNYRRNSIQIRKGDAIDTTIYLNEKIDIRLLRCKGYYDARDTSIWGLDSLGKLIEATFKDRIFTPSFALRLSDKDGKRLDTYKYEMLNIAAWTYHFEIPLGFLEHHHLSAEFVYPLSQLWHTTWDKMITTLMLTIILVTLLYYLNRRLRREKERSQFRKDSADRLVHNLRSPMIYVKQQLSIVMEPKLVPKEQMEVLGRCQGKTNDMLENISILLHESMNTHKLEAHPEQYDLNGIVEKVIEEHKDSYAEKQITITANNQLTEDVYIDPIQIEVALSNLISNAIKYSGLAPCINISYWKKKKSLMLSVEDNGIGIQKSEQKKIFRREYRVKPKGNIEKNKKDNVRSKGYGIGLHCVKSITLAHHGKISVVSDGKTGSTFTIEIPQKEKKA